MAGLQGVILAAGQGARIEPGTEITSLATADGQSKASVSIMDLDANAEYKIAHLSQSVPHCHTRILIASDKCVLNNAGPATVHATFTMEVEGPMGGSSELSSMEEGESELGSSEMEAELNKEKNSGAREALRQAQAKKEAEQLERVRNAQAEAASKRAAEAEAERKAAAKAAEAQKKAAERKAQADAKQKEQVVKNQQKELSSKTLPGGTIVKTVKAGSGSACKKGDRITMKYIGTLKSGKRFDAGSIPFRVGVGEVIKGWDLGVVGMQVGERRLLQIPPAQGYGARGAPPDIPGNATLMFDCTRTK